jgi:Acetyltransferase (GNAT) domain
MTARTIRTLNAAEVGTLVGWAADEGWNPGLDDADAFRTADPDGFIGAFLGEEMVAGISVVAYGDDFGFIGLYICRPDWRGQGHGKAVWDAGMARLGNRTIGLDGVVEQQANYASMGFAPAYRTVRYSGRLDLSAGPGDGVRPITPDLVPGILAYDRQCFPGPRKAFLEKWLRPPRTAFAIENHGAITGYGCARQCREGWKIGPLFADNMDASNRLLGALAGNAGSSDLHIDVPETNGGFAKLLMASGLRSGFETARMYRGRTPRIVQKRVFGITTLELG